MAVAAKRCELPGCSEVFVAKRPNARYCSDTCRQRAHRRGDSKPKPAEPPIGTQDRVTGLGAVVRAQLETVERLDTIFGQAALVMATRIDDATDTGAGIAALVKQLEVTIDRALEGLKVDHDLVDDLQERRDAKRDRASAG